MEIVKALIEHGADVNVRGLDGDTPLHDAAVNGHEEITIVLIQSGGNPESENDKKETPIEVAEGKPQIQGLFCYTLKTPNKGLQITKFIFNRKSKKWQIRKDF